MEIITNKTLFIFLKRLRLLLCLSIILFVFTTPSHVQAEKVTITTVTVKINTSTLESKDYENYTLSIAKDGSNYEDDSARHTDGSSYMVFIKTIKRCASTTPAKDETNWVIKLTHDDPKVSGDTRVETIEATASICGSPTFTRSARYNIIRTGGSSCSACPVTTPETSGYTDTMSGILEKASGIFKVNPKSGSTLVLGTTPNIVKWDASDDVWVPDTPIVGDKYSCDYSGTLANPTKARCRWGSESPEEKETIDPAVDDDSSSTTSGDTSTDDSKEKAVPFTITFDGKGIPTIGIDKTRCPDGSTTYTSGILKGIPCDGTLKTLDEALILIKNVIMVFLLPLVGTLFLIMLIIGGILYITSRGNQQQLDRAKKTLTGAIIGLLIVTLSYTIIAIFANVIGGKIT